MRDKIKMIIDEWDPIGLLYGEAPEDEYDPEINEIFKLLPSVESPEDLAAIIQKIFIQYFDDELFRWDYNDCLLIAKRILEKA